MGKVPPFLDKKNFIASGDFIVREQIKAHLETLGLYENVKTANSPYEVPKNLKKILTVRMLLSSHYLKVLASASLVACYREDSIINLRILLSDLVLLSWPLPGILRYNSNSEYNHRS